MLPRMNVPSYNYNVTSKMAFALILSPPHSLPDSSVYFPKAYVTVLFSPKHI